jgi:hypothetical protein
MPAFPAGRRSERVHILQRSVGAGGSRGDFALAFACYAAVYAKGGGQQVEGGRAANGTVYEIVLPDDSKTRTVAIDDRVLWKGRTMDVTRADAPDRLKQSITIAVADVRGG